MTAWGARLGAGTPPPDDALEPYAKVVVRHANWVSEGTGFFIDVPNWGYLVVTAKHVLIGQVQSIEVICEASGQAVSLQAAAYAYEVGTASAADVGVIALAHEANVSGYAWGTAPNGTFPADLIGYPARARADAPFPKLSVLACNARNQDPVLLLSVAGRAGMSGGPVVTDHAILEGEVVGFGVVGIYTSDGTAYELPASALGECSEKIRALLGL